MLGTSSTTHETIDLTHEMDMDDSDIVRRAPNGHHPHPNGFPIPQQPQQPYPYHKAPTGVTPAMARLPLPSGPQPGYQNSYHPQQPGLIMQPQLPPAPNGHMNGHASLPPPFSGPSHPPSGRHHVIDLTDAPSPGPSSQPYPRPPQTDNNQPVCIGQLKVTALVLYPCEYLIMLQQGNEHILSPEAKAHPLARDELAPVKLVYEPANRKTGTGLAAQETIKILQPPSKGRPTSESFAVVEQKAANVLGPMLGRGLLRVDARLQRTGNTRPQMLPLLLLVFTLPPNVPTISDLFAKAGLYLDHPYQQYDPSKHHGAQYSNPHNPPPGGYRFGPAARPGSNYVAQPYIQGKTLEVQRSQVEEVFKALRPGEELRETEPRAEIGTKLYPHQKQALTFLLEREGELRGGFSMFKRLDGKREKWRCLVTSKEFDHPPPSCKGAILADDMGLGKTITVVSLIAATMDSAATYGGTPAPHSIARPPVPKERGPPLTAAHFAGSVWGMPSAPAALPPPTPSIQSTPEPVPKKSKSEKAEKSEKKKLRSEWARQERVKCRSRATLIVCPLSTVVNWEDQLKEHWAGEVTVVGGGGLPVLPPAAYDTRADYATGGPAKNGQGYKANKAPLRVYVYHGNARRPDPMFLADFDVVITTYSTLATEYSKQAKTSAAAEEDDEDEDMKQEDDDDGSSDDILEVDDQGEPLDVKPKIKPVVGMKRKREMPTAEIPSPLQQVDWFRVVLDEAHSIKEPSTVACRAACDLIANRRTCLTGTPVQNKLDDVYALIKFIRLVPFEDKAVWTEYIGGPAKFGQPLGVARLQTIMKSITLRRTKETKNETGKNILDLPPRSDKLVMLTLDEKERKIYDSIFDASKADFQEMTKKGEVMKNYVGILQRILRLRQICDHYELVQQKGQLDDSELEPEELINAIQKDGINLARATAVFNLLRDSATAQCVECSFELATASPPTDEVDGEIHGTSKKAKKAKATGFVPRAVLTRCQHLFCMRCFQASVCPNWPKVPTTISRPCSICRTVLVPTVDAVEVMTDGTMPDPAATSKPKTTAAKRKERKDKGENIMPGDHVEMSTKIRHLMKELMQSSQANPFSRNYSPESIEIQAVDQNGQYMSDGVVKTVVFSQWTSMLDKIEDALQSGGIRYDRLDGTMRRDERTKAMDALKNDPACEVLLVSLRAGGVGLNLTAAQRVYLMDPYWNPAVENQAVDRIHRLGQTRPVTTIKLVIEDTVEARMLEVQKRKTALANMTLGQTLSKAQMMERRMEELNTLFGA